MVEGRMKPSLKARLAAGELIVGTFVKTPSPIMVEVLALSALDCLCLDAEHAPFDRAAIDSCLLAARAGGMDVLVRVPSAAPEHLLNALDGGAIGVVVPHVRSAQEARAVVDACHYANFAKCGQSKGSRGYAGSSRAAGYTTLPMSQHKANSAARTVVIAQIEDPEAVECIDEIATVDGLDALYLGRVDLTVAYGADKLDDPRVVAAMETVCAAARQHGRPVGMFLSKPEEAARWRNEGATLFLLGSDHGFLLNGAAALHHQIKSAI